MSYKRNYKRYKNKKDRKHIDDIKLRNHFFELIKENSKDAEKELALIKECIYCLWNDISVSEDVIEDTKTIIKKRNLGEKFLLCLLYNVNLEE